MVSEKNFEAHLAANPEMWEMFVKYAVQLGERGKRFSAAGIFHLMRYETAVTEQGSPFKISQNWCPLYARKFAEDYPQYDVFRIQGPRQ